MTSYTPRSLEEIPAETERSEAEFSDAWHHVVAARELQFMQGLSFAEIVRARFSKDDLLDEVRDWLAENVAEGDYCIHQRLIKFKALNDAIFFKLRWC